MTVLIADDEERIRKGLRGTIELRLPALRVVGEAEDGEGALALARELKPDILLIDINMPFLNGLDLISRLAGARQDCIIIVISGHDEFDYARRALALQVFEYVLKPVDKDELQDVLERAVRELVRRREQDHYLAWAREQVARNRDVLVERFMRDWVGGRLDATEIRGQLAGFNLDFRPVSAMVLLRPEERLGVKGARSEMDHRLFLYALRRLAEETLAAFGPVCAVVDDAEQVLVLTEKSGGTAWVDTLAGLESNCAMQLRQSVFLAQTAVETSEFPGLPGLAEAWSRLCDELSRRGGNAALVLHARTIIERHYRDPNLSLESVAEGLEISSGYLSRLLKQETGQSFVDYLTGYRIHQALILLQDPSVKVFEAAERCGYRSQQYFSRAFRRVMGCPPVDYRRHGRAAPEVQS